MSDLRTAAQQALEALEAGPDVDPIFAGETADALRAALAEPVQEPDTDCHLQGICQRSGYSLLAQPVQEPVAWMVYTEGGTSAYVTDNPNDLVGAYRALALYTAPPQRKPLTEEVATLTAQRDALLEALKDATKTIEHLGYPLAAIERARAAIKAVEETK